MRFHWLRDKERTQHLRVFWDKGKRNGADYFTKHHPAPYHKLMRAKYILALHHIMSINKSHILPNNVARARVCWNIPTVHIDSHTTSKDRPSMTSEDANPMTNFSIIN